MVAAIKWEGTSSATEIMTTALNSLADNTISAASTEVDNSTGLNTFMWFELNAIFGTSPDDANPTVDLYIIQAPDGTNYASAPITGGVDQDHLILVNIPVRKVTSAQRLVVGPFPAPPHKIKVYADNQTGQSMAASGNTIDIYVNNLESQ